MTETSKPNRVFPQWFGIMACSPTGVNALTAADDPASGPADVWQAGEAKAGTDQRTIVAQGASHPPRKNGSGFQELRHSARSGVEPDRISVPLTQQTKGRMT
jgi:hypothetical protein